MSSMSTNPTLGHQVRGFPQKRLVGKRLSKKNVHAKEQFYYSNTIYSLNGGPVYKADHPSTAKSLSPSRDKEKVFFTAEYPGGIPLVTPEEMRTMAHTSLNKNRPKGNSPYLSEDEFKLLNQYYDIQCEPTSYHRKGVPLMRVKRISRGKPKMSQSFFAYVPASYLVPQAGSPAVFT